MSIGLCRLMHLEFFRDTRSSYCPRRASLSYLLNINYTVLHTFFIPHYAHCSVIFFARPASTIVTIYIIHACTGRPHKLIIMPFGKISERYFNTCKSYIDRTPNNGFRVSCQGIPVSFTRVINPCPQMLFCGFRRRSLTFLPRAHFQTMQLE